MNWNEEYNFKMNLFQHFGDTTGVRTNKTLQSYMLYKFISTRMDFKFQLLLPLPVPVSYY